jgi:hypothetical protein
MESILNNFVVRYVACKAVERVTFDISEFYDSVVDLFAGNYSI